MTSPGEEEPARLRYGPAPTYSQRLLWAACLCYGLAAVSLFVDSAVSQFFKSRPLRGDWFKVFQLAEVFGHGYGAIAILACARVLAPEKRRQVLAAVVTVVVAGLAVNGVKSCVLRVRPEHFDLTQRGLDSFLGFATFTTPPGYEHYFDARLHSFPSGHTCTAVSLAVSLTAIAPHGRWLFTLFAVLASAQRVVTRDHFPSDVWVGAATGLIVAWLVWHPRVLGGWAMPLFSDDRDRGPVNHVLLDRKRRPEHGQG